MEWCLVCQPYLNGRSILRLPEKKEKGLSWISGVVSAIFAYNGLNVKQVNISMSM
jgi:hypothetical protein